MVSQIGSYISLLLITYSQQRLTLLLMTSLCQITKQARTKAGAKSWKFQEKILRNRLAAAEDDKPCPCGYYRLVYDQKAKARTNWAYMSKRAHFFNCELWLSSPDKSKGFVHFLKPSFDQILEDELGLEGQGFSETVSSLNLTNNLSPVSRVILEKTRFSQFCLDLLQ